MSEMPLYYKSMMLFASGIDACIEKKLNTPALILIYSAIDTTGWLDSSEEFATKASFMKWVDAYLLKAKPLRCTSLDLYAARCGLLHTFTPDSQLSILRKARRIYYAWGTASIQDLQRTIDFTNKSEEYVAVHVNDLYEALQLGLIRFSEELENDPGRKVRVYKKAGKFFADFSLEAMSDVLTVINDKGV
jgi:hypothetical protein